MEKKYKKITLDATTNAYLVNRYLAFWHFQKFDKKKKLIEEKKGYKIQWQNIKSDLANVFANPVELLPKMAMSLAAFYFIFRGNHEAAINLSFFTGAIAADAAAGSNGGTSTLTFAHTTGASLSDSMIAVGVSVQDSNHANIPITGITYAAVALTNVRQDTSSTNNVSAALRYLLAPTAGANNVVVTCTGALWKAAIASTWSGVKQSAQPDAQAGKGTNNQTSSSPSIAITTVADNSLIIDVLSSEAARTALGTGQTTLGTQQGQSFENLSCSYEIKATAGAETMSATISSSQKYNMIAVSFAPAVAGGILVKTAGGLAQGLVKSYNGLATASTKTKNGLSNVL